HVQQYGDLTIAQLPASQFLGSKKSVIPLSIPNPTKVTSDSKVSNRDVPLVLARGQDRVNLVYGRQWLDIHMNAYVNSVQHLFSGQSVDVLNTRLELNDRQCYHRFVDTFNDKCMNIAQNSYALGKLYIK
ncbi:unnamed protein product, partial [Oppiella nova]